jgi:hypothetical protein
VDRHAARWYGRRVRLALVLLVVVFLTPLVRAEDPVEEPKSGLSQRLRAIDDSAEFEADNPERAGDDRADVAEEPEDPTAAPFDEGDPAAAPPRAGRRAATRGRARSAATPSTTPGAPPSTPPAPPPALGSTLESPIATSPLAPPSNADDDY